MRMSVHIRSSLLIFPICVGSMAHAQSSSRYSEADSAAVFDAAVDQILGMDTTVTMPSSKDSSGAQSTRYPRVFVRLGALPSGAWAAPSIARLRAHRWRYFGLAVDSATTTTTSSLSSKAIPIPEILSVALRFKGDTAVARVSWDMYTCESHRSGMHGILYNNTIFVRTPTGWRSEGPGSSGIADALC
jgi:hypothetical protein